MYVLNFEGLRMKANTEKDLRQWIRENLDAAFNFGDLRRDGYAESVCGRYDIAKADGRTLQDVLDVSCYACYGGVLVDLVTPADDAEETHNCRSFAVWKENGPKGDGYYCDECGQFITSNAFE